MLQALDEIQALDAQTRIEVMRGVNLRRNERGMPVLSIHYSANPERDPATPVGAEWVKRARSEYSSESDWNREQEIDAYTGGGENVFGKVLGKHFDKVVITDPRWFPDPRWDAVEGFDHGGTNATCLLRAYIDFYKNVYFCGEFYSMRREGWENTVAMNCPLILQMPWRDRVRWTMADPSIFDESQVQEDGSKSSIVKSYIRNGVKFLTQFRGELSDITFVETMLSYYWRGLDAGEKPKAFIVCRNPSDRLQPGLHQYDCPNLLWELKRAKRAKLTAKQLLTRNPTEKIVDKMNHARDACKLIAHTVRRPTGVSEEAVFRENLAKIEDPTSRQIYAERELKRISGTKKTRGTIDMTKKRKWY